ncbi:MAG TPA: VWA domain-containing protein, partial [Candidatus Ozemobacteraceae bacterium]|nr:VWA domain-containing protein [Candidatus Ozemobacteraceae bacterium]
MPSNPDALLLFLPLFFLVRLWIKTPLLISAFGKRVLLSLKLIIIALLVFALTDPRLPGRTIQNAFRLVYLVDASASADPASRADTFRSLSRQARELPPGCDPVVISFAGSTKSIPPGEFLALADAPDSAIEAFCNSIKNTSDTDMGSALQAALNEIPAGQRGRIILCSDGQDTHDSLSDALDNLRQSNVPVTVVRMERRKQDSDLQLVRLSLPERSYAGEELALQALVRHETGGLIDMLVQATDGTVQKQTASVPAGLSSIHSVLKPSRPGSLLITLQISRPGDGGSPIFRRQAVTIRPAPRIAVFDNSVHEGRFFRELLATEKIEFVSACPGSWPVDLPAFVKSSPCVVLNDLPRSLFKPSEIIAIRDHVKSGAGLLMIGGPQSFGPGNYTDTPIEEALPVRMPRRTINQPLALVLVLDCSGSMAAYGWPYLVEATKSIIRQCRGQYIGIILFNHTPYWILPLKQLTDPEAVCQLLDNYYAFGGTIFSLPLVEALTALRDQPFSQKTILMMSDGVPSDFDEVQALLPAFRDYGIPVTTIAAGHDVDLNNLETIARLHSEQIENWLQERSADIAVFANNAAFAQDVKACALGQAAAAVLGEHVV